MSSVSKNLETGIGFITLIMICFLLYHFTKQYFVFNPSKYEQYSTYKATFSDIDGLNVGSSVKIGGIPVGNLVEYSIDPKTYKISVLFSVMDKYKIPGDTSISVATAGFIGEKYLQLAMGASSEILKDGEEIIYTQSSLNLEKLVALLKK